MLKAGEEGLVNIQVRLKNPESFKKQLCKHIETVVTDDLKDFSDFNAFYGPNELYGGNFSSSKGRRVGS